MKDPALFFVILLYSLVGTWALAILYHFIRHKRFKYAHFEFNYKNYYLLMAPFVFTVFYYAYLVESNFIIWVFLSFAIAGIIGEMVFSLTWDSLFDKRFWVYQVETLADGYSSALNLIPWGFGGLLYLAVVKIFSERFGAYNSDLVIKNGLWFKFSLLYLLVLIAVYLISYFIRPRRRFGFEFKELNLGTYTLFVLPMLVPIAYFSIYVASDFFILALAFGMVAFLNEYLLGKFIEFFISRKLWHYSYETFDHRHSTPLSFIPFAFGGFYFWFIYVLVTQVIS